MAALRRGPAAAAVLLGAAILTGGGCGAGGGLARVLPGPAGRLNPIYDVMVVFPDTDIIIGGLPHRGLEIDLGVEFGVETLADEDPIYLAEARVVEVRAGGVAQPFEVGGPLDIEGTLRDDLLATGLFGPVRVATATLILDLTGSLLDSRRRVAGEAALYGTGERGTFLAVKRRRYLVAATDFMEFGRTSLVSVRYDTRFSIEESPDFISSDPVARMEDGRPLIVNRLGSDNVQGLDPFSFTTVFEHSVGNGANPHDAVILRPAAAGVPEAGAGHPGFAFVTRYGPDFNDVAILDLETGDLAGAIDLRPYAMNPDRTPRPDQIVEHGGLLFVTLLDVDRSFTRYATGRMVVIDPVARAVTGVIDLPGQNPFETLFFSAATGRIVLNLAGIFPGLLAQALTGGIVTIDPESRTATLLVDDDRLGGNVAGVALHSAVRGWCVVSDAAYRNAIKGFNPATGEVLETIHDSPNLISALETDGDGYLVVAEDDFFEPRLLIFDAATGGRIATLPLRLAPLSLAILTRSL
jgi:hypothetical protein